MNMREQTTDYSLLFLIQRLRVPTGYTMAILIALFSRQSWRSLAVAVPIAFAVALLRAWASGKLRKNAELAVSGAYALTRNPLYFCSFVMATGCAVCGGSLLLALWL